ncbi:MAG: cupin domain-containing protein [Thaumarchaeota archaeon]|nr:cupin domain-containing protein [Nitrososphaerota archaeon]
MPKSTVQRKSLDSPDETRSFENGKADIVHLGDVTVGRMTYQPGWSWSKSVKPIVKTDSCQFHHVGYTISGKIKVVMNDGKETECGPGEAIVVPPGHDAWVVGNEPWVGLDFSGMKDYGKSRTTPKKAKKKTKKKARKR